MWSKSVFTPPLHFATLTSLIELSELDAVRAPRDKARILVDAHQIVVGMSVSFRIITSYADVELDGLSKLPPIRLMSAEESKALRERLQQQAAAKEMKENTLPPEEAQFSSMSSATASTTVVTTSTEPTLLVSATSPTSATSLVITEVTQQAELSPLSFSTADTLPSASPSRSSSPLPDTSTSHHENGDDEESKPDNPTPVSSDILLPMIIFSVVKSNPPHLVSNLLYTQRFRNQNAYTHGENGEESFCLINVLAVAEFLENVDLEGLGLGSSGGIRYSLFFLEAYPDSN